MGVKGRLMTDDLIARTARTRTRAGAVQGRARRAGAVAWQLRQQAHTCRARSTATRDRTEAVALQSTAARLGMPSPLLYPDQCT